MMGQVQFHVAAQRTAEGDRLVVSQHPTVRPNATFRSLCVRNAADVEREMVRCEGSRDPATQDVARSGRRNRRSVNTALPQEPRFFKTALAGQRRPEEGMKKSKDAMDLGVRSR